jgi:flagellar biosynthesis GTPase FlhF
MLPYIIGTMLAAGIVGGLINSYLADSMVEKPLVWWKHIIVGIGAAFMVPVFLNMISSRLISEISGTEITSEVLSKLLVLTGFCLLAAVSSRAFIRSMTDKLLQEVSAAKKEAKEAKAQAENAEVIAEASAKMEPERSSALEAVEEKTAQSSPNVQISDIEQKILKAMVESKFSMRSLTGIAKDAELSAALVNRAMGELIQKQLVTEAKNRDGQLRWYPTAEGRQAANGA